jgi:hypothetical protein
VGVGGAACARCYRRRRRRPRRRVRAGGATAFNLYSTAAPPNSTVGNPIITSYSTTLSLRMPTPTKASHHACPSRRRPPPPPHSLRRRKPPLHPPAPPPSPDVASFTPSPPPPPPTSALPKFPFHPPTTPPPPSPAELVRVASERSSTAHRCTDEEEILPRGSMFGSGTLRSVESGFEIRRERKDTFHPSQTSTG